MLTLILSIYNQFLICNIYHIFSFYTSSINLIGAYFYFNKIRHKLVIYGKIIINIGKGIDRMIYGVVETISEELRKALQQEILYQVRWVIIILVIVTIITLFQIIFNFKKSWDIATLTGDNVNIKKRIDYLFKDKKSIPENTNNENLINSLNEEIKDLTEKYSNLKDEQIALNAKIDMLVKLNNQIMDK